MNTPQTSCSDCNNPLPVMPTSHCVGTGYAVLPATGEHICYPCSDKRERAELLDRSRPVCAYVSGDGSRITTWTGGDLMRIVRSRTVRLTRESFTHGRTIQSIRAVDCHGGEWIGQGNPGISIRLRPVGKH